MVEHELVVTVSTTDEQAMSVVLLEVTKAALRGNPVWFEAAGHRVEILHAGFVRTEIES